MELILSNVDYIKNGNNILQNINLSLSDNSIISIIGKNGSGKTSLMDVISLRETLTEGSISYKNKCIKNNSAKKDLDIFRSKVHYSFQEPYIQMINIPSINEFDNINIKELYVEFFCEKNDKNKMSFGQLKKLQFLDSILSNKPILLLDDIDSGIDNKSVNTIIKFLKKYKSRDKIIIISSNNIDFVLEVSDFVVVLDKGKIIFSGNKYDIFKDEALLKKIGLLPPKIIEFENYVLKEKNIRLGYRDQINDLLKDIYRNV